MQQICKLPLLIALLAVVVLSGCSGKTIATPKIYWPPPPMEPKMQWINSFSSADNFEKTAAQRQAEKFLGHKKLDFLQKPMSVAVDSAGLVYVADLDIGNIWSLDFAKKTMSLYSENVSVGLPVSLAIDSKDNLYVVDVKGGHVLVFDARRNPVKVIGQGDFGKPVFATVDEERGRLYVSDIIKNKVFVYDLGSGEKLFDFGGRGSGAGALHGPQGIAIDKEGRVFVAEQFNARVQVFDAQGKHLYMFGKRGDKPFEFEGPRGLAFDREGNLFVAEVRKAALFVFRPDGTPLTALGGKRTTHHLGFTFPSGVYIDRNQRVYVSDGMNRRVSIWQMLTPEYLAEHPLDVGSLREAGEKLQEIKPEE